MDNGRPKRTIVSLMWVVAFFALTVAALRTPSDLMSSSLFSLAVGFVAVSGLCSLSLSGGARQAYAGAALIAFGYQVLVFAPWFSTDVRAHLISTNLLDYLYSFIQGKPPLRRGMTFPILHISGSAHGYTLETGEHSLQAHGANLQMNFERIGHSAISIILGSLSYHFVLRLCRRSRQTQAV